MSPSRSAVAALLAVLVAVAVAGAAVVLQGGASDGPGATDVPQIAARDANDKKVEGHDSGNAVGGGGGGDASRQQGGGGTGTPVDGARGSGARGARGGRSARARRGAARRGGRGGSTLEGGDGGSASGGASGSIGGGNGSAGGGSGSGSGGQSGSGGDGGGNGSGSGGGGAAPGSGSGAPGGAAGGGPAFDGSGGASETSASNEVKVGPAFENDPPVVSFGVVAIGTPSRIRITLRNVAEDGGSRTVTRVGFGADDGSDFAVTENNCQDVALPQGGACTLQVTFTPTAGGERTTLLGISLGPCCGRTIKLQGGI